MGVKFVACVAVFSVPLSGRKSRERMGREYKEEAGGGWGGKEKPSAEPLHFTKRCSWTNGGN